ncbi:glycoside hydrolase family 114 protein, partial [Piromyces sp. E2]
MYSKKGEYDVIDIDLYDVTKESISKMHDLGLKVICYFSAGTYEPFRTEAKAMQNVSGLVRNKMDDWDENWLDIRLEEIKPFMTDRLDLAKSKGCDGIEFDNIDAYTAVNWKDKLTANDQLKYNRWLAEEAHARDLAAGLKNCIELLNDLKDVYDFAINEQCSDFDECGKYEVFLKNNLAVFVALYGKTSDT